jgi:hypothetical protein
MKQMEAAATVPLTSNENTIGNEGCIINLPS